MPNKIFMHVLIALFCCNTTGMAGALAPLDAAHEHPHEQQTCDFPQGKASPCPCLLSWQLREAEQQQAAPAVTLGWVPSWCLLPGSLPLREAHPRYPPPWLQVWEQERGLHHPVPPASGGSMKSIEL
jgi:hypothetical protein